MSLAAPIAAQRAEHGSQHFFSREHADIDSFRGSPAYRPAGYAPPQRQCVVTTPMILTRSLE